MKKRYPIPNRTTLSRLAALFFIQVQFAAHAVPAPPDAGQTIRELQKQPEVNAPKAATPLQVEREAAPKDAVNDSLRIAVNAIHIQGNSLFPSKELDALVSDLIGGEHTFAELDAGAGRITAWYRERGYVVARAYLPAQEIRDGVLTINVLEGLVGQQHITNQALLSDDLARGYLGDIKSGEALQAKLVDRAVLLLTDNPGVGGARATLQPGASVGTADLVIELTPAAPYAGSVELDNYGNRYSGANRLGAMLAVNSPLRMGDQLSVRALKSDLNLTYARIAYQLPLDGHGWRLGAAYSDTHYRLGQEFASLLAHGTASSASLYVVYPFVRSQVSNLSGTLTWEDKRLNDLTDSTLTSIDKRVKLANFGLTGNFQDSVGGGAITSVDLSLVSGQLGMDAVSLATDAASANSNGRFARLSYTINRQQRLTDTQTLSIALSGQQASKNLSSSEKFSLGGAYGVRAYPQGEGSGDQGALLNLELRQAFNDQVTGVAFYDTGSVMIDRNSFTPGANNRHLAGAGIGAQASFNAVQVKTYLAWRTSGGQPASEPATVNRNPRLWLQAVMQF